MSTLQVANIHFESTANNRIQYAGSNTLTVVAGGANVVSANSTTFSINKVLIANGSAGTSGQYLTSGGSSSNTYWTSINFPTVSGTLIRAPQVLTTGTSYTTPANCTSIYVECVGAGGGGAGATGTSGQGGGGSGAYCAKLFTVTESTAYTYAIGSGGSGAGGSTTFTVGATTITAGGGGSGSSTTGGTGGTATNGDINITGAGGGQGSTTVAIGGAGGSSFFGGGARGKCGSTQSGDAGTSGGGGGGGCSGGSNSSGGNGGNGLIRIWEFA